MILVCVKESQILTIVATSRACFSALLRTSRGATSLQVSPELLSDGEPLASPDTGKIPCSGQASWVMHGHTSESYYSRGSREYLFKGTILSRLSMSSNLILNRPEIYLYNSIRNIVSQNLSQSIHNSNHAITTRLRIPFTETYKWCNSQFLKSQKLHVGLPYFESLTPNLLVFITSISPAIRQW
jgi:hypothetical protein